MSRRSWKRTVAVLVIVGVCALAVPATAGTSAVTMDSSYFPSGWLWAKGMDWLRGLWTSLHVGNGAYKFGAGHTSDGHALAKAAD